MWFKGEAVYLSTTLYPIVAIEKFDTTSFDVITGAIYLWEPLEFDSTLSVESGVLTVTRAWENYTYRQNASTDEEEYDVTMEVDSGVLTIVRAFVNYIYRQDAIINEEEYDVTISVENGDLVIVRAFIYHTQPEEHYDVSFGVVSGTLITI